MARTGKRAPGDWGGLIIVGNGLINRTASPIYTEGPVGAAEDYSGGTDFNDSSGSLKYVRVDSPATTSRTAAGRS